MGSLFSLPVFFIILRETTEAAIIVSVLLAFVKQVIVDDAALLRRLKWHIWIGVLIGLVISLIIGGTFIGLWKSLAKNVFQSSEEIWEGTFALIACIMITVMSLAMLKSQELQEKWRGKLGEAMQNANEKRSVRNLSAKYALLILPMITVLREGLEAMIFVGGVSISCRFLSFNLVQADEWFFFALIGFVIYRGGSRLALHRFFIASTCLLLLIAAGLFAKAINAYEMDKWGKIVGGDADDAGSYDPRGNVWALNYGDPNQPENGGWAFFNSILGWMHVASVGTITGYCVYWLVVILTIVFMKIKGNRARAAASQHTYANEKAVEKTEI
ncbi:high-affinity iron permease [Linnemannia gamsii]|uniref:High-affinity iron permease n=1 Tax=Linnemannia gamsii TaxID=64522 RepID=A0ABQ7K0R4_9FUNG|nr:high-affinity iron permease [Linnemannia gamsii]